MKAVSATLALLGVVFASLPARAQDDERTRRILDRIEKELTESRKKLRAEIRDIIRAEIERARTPKKPAPSRPGLTEQIKAFADKLKDDGGLNTRLRKFVKSDKGAAFIRKQLVESGEYATLEEAIEAYCVKGKDGKYVVRAEHVEAVREMLDQEGGAAPKPRKKVRLGIIAEDFAPGERAKLGVRGGIKIAEVREPAKAAGLRGGDVLLEIAGKPVTEETILQIIGKYGPGDVVKVTVLRGKARRTFDLKLAERKE